MFFVHEQDVFLVDYTRALFLVLACCWKVLLPLSVHEVLCGMWLHIAEFVIAVKPLVINSESLRHLF